MSARLRVELLGGFRALRTDAASCALPTRKCEALLAYLSLPAGRPHARDSLAALLWGDTGEPQARQSLRQALRHLRLALGEGVIVTRGDTVSLETGAVVVDVGELEAGLAEPTLAGLERAVDLYKGEFLAGVRVSEQPFEEWLTVHRERIHELVLDALVRILREQMRADRPEAAIQTARRMLALDPLQEPIHRALMRLLLRLGRRGAALQQYQACLVSLRRELGTEPDEETRRLYQEILLTMGSATAREWSTGTRAVDTPAFGRTVELEALDTVTSRVLDTGGRVVLITGEAGIGKSRLLQESLTRAAARGARILFGRCHQTEQTLPFRPWIEALRGDGRGLEPAVRDRLSALARTQIAALCPELIPADAVTPPAAAPALLFDPILELVAALAAEQPLIVAIEDLHWADTMSARLLAFLGRRLARWPVLLVGTLRPEDAVDIPAMGQAIRELRADGRLDEVTLGPLSETDSQMLAEALWPSARARDDWDRVKSQVWTLSGGNPFVIVESVRTVAERGPGAWAQGPQLGARVQDFIAARLEQLSELPRRCVAVAATIGRDFPFALLRRAGGLEEAEAAEAVETLVRRRILDVVDDRLDFCHEWVRRVAYEALLPPTRQLLHAAVGDALRERHADRLDDVADELGTHYSRAGDAAKAIPHLTRFGQLAARRYALDDAQRALAQAVASVDRLPPEQRDRHRLDATLHQAFLLSMLGRQQEILGLLQGLAGSVERVADPALTAEYYFRLGLTQYFIGDNAAARASAARALTVAEGRGDPEAIGKALHVLSLCACERGELRDGIAHATRAIGLLDRPDSQAWLGLVYQDLALNCVAAGELQDALRAAERMESIGRTASTPRLLPFAAYVRTWVQALRGETALAIDTATRGLAIARDSMVKGLITASRGYARVEQGDAAGAVKDLTEALELLRDSPVRHVEIRALAMLAEAHLLGGDPNRAGEQAERALTLAQASELRPNIGLAQRVLGRVARARGALQEAERWVSAALATFVGCDARFEAGRTYYDLATISGAGGHLEAAREQLAAALAIFEAAGGPARVAEVQALARTLFTVGATLLP